MLEHQATLKKQYTSCIIASIGCICAGSVLAWTSPTLPQLRSPSGGLNLTETQASLVGSIVAIGACTAAIPTGFLLRKYGIKTTLKIFSTFFTIAWILIAYASSVHLLYVARFLGGLSSGAICICVPMYIGEIASVEHRGVLGSFFQISFCTGILLVNVVGAYLDWRNASLLLTVLPIAYFFLLFFIDSVNHHELSSRKSLDGFENSNLLKERNNVKALVVALGLVFFQQFSGINAIIFYTSSIFALTGSAISASKATIIVTASQVMFSCVSASIIERFNRRTFLLISSLGMATSLIMLATFFHIKSLNFETSTINFIPLVSLVLFILSFCAGFGPIPWMTMGEIFAQNFKSYGCGIATTFNWILIFGITALFPTVCALLGEHSIFYILAGFNLLAAAFTLLHVPETRGKSNEEIQFFLTNNHNL